MQSLSLIPGTDFKIVMGRLVAPEHRDLFKKPQMRLFFFYCARFFYPNQSDPRTGYATFTI